MEKKVEQSCPVCDSKNKAIYLEPWNTEESPDRLYGAASGIRGCQTLVKCKDCGMIYESPRYSDETIVEAYKNSEEAGHDSQYGMRVKSFKKALESLAARIPEKGAKVLDIGTAGGAFLEAATKFGYDAYGMEPSADLTNRGVARGLNIRQGTIDSHTFPEESFDMITLWDVIEHLPDPKTALIEVNRLLRPGGTLLINYPDIGTKQAAIAGKSFWWILSVHLHHFTRKSIKSICDKTGFSVVWYQRYWQILEIGYLQKIAQVYNIPLSRTIERLTPGFIKRVELPYYASQTTVIARKGDQK